MIALETRMFQQNASMLHLTGMCLGAGLGPENNTRRDGTVAYYLDEPVVEDEQKGAGVCMMCYGEWLMLCAAEPAQANGTPAILIYNNGY
ncbi:hypothetical protein V6615_16155 [Oscillospiraceae bacterium PP1C4]